MNSKFQSKNEVRIILNKMTREKLFAIEKILFLLEESQFISH